MDNVISTMCLFVRFLLISLVSASYKDLNKVTVKAGENATLHCQSSQDGIITLLEWVRPDLNSDGYVFFYRDEHLYENYLHPSFVDRVELRDPKMKKGDVSVILKNVSSNDTGTYECHVSLSKSSRRKRAAPDFTKTIELVVEDSGHTAADIWDGGNMRRHVVLILPFTGVIAVGFWIFMKRKGQNSDPSTDEELHHQQV